MVDISKCHGTDCPKKEQCYRYTGVSVDKRQSYFSLPPYSHESNVCAYFWDKDNMEVDDK